MTVAKFVWHPSDRELRLWACWLAAFLCGLGIVIGLRTGAWGRFPLLAVGAAASGVTGWLRPAALRPVYRGWMLATYPIGWLIGHLVLALLYFGCVTPLGLALRATGRLKFDRGSRSGANSYWRALPDPAPNEQYFRPF